MSDDLTLRHQHALHKIDVLEDEIDVLKAKLAECEARLEKAVETISLCRKMQAQFAHTEDPLMVLLDTTIAELSSVSCANLKGQKDE
jgi:hypothetical protein